MWMKVFRANFEESATITTRDDDSIICRIICASARWVVESPFSGEMPPTPMIATSR